MRIAVAVAVVCLLEMGVASALDADESPADDVSRLSEIIVTAQKRSEDLQKTPLAVTAITSQELNEQNITNVADLTGSVPGLEVSESVGLHFSLRGIADTNIDTNVQDPTAVHFDGVYSIQPTAANGQLFDIARVEVLRGPQGTLYGQNAAAGVINIITNKPVDEFEASGEVGSGNYGRLETGGMINLPISDTLQFRAAFQTVYHQGYLSQADAPSAPRFDDQDSQAARMWLHWEPATSVSILLGLDYKHEGGNGPGQVVEPHNQTEAAGGPPPESVPANNGFLMPTFYGSSAGGQWNFLGTPLYDLTTYSVHAQVDWTIADDLLLTWIPSYRHESLDQDDPLVGLLPDFTIGNRETSNELRLSNQSGALSAHQLQWTVGLYQHENISPFVNNINLFQNSAALFWQYFPNQNGKSYAEFAQATYAIVDWLRVTGGIRNSSDNKTIDGNETVGPAQDTGTVVVNANGDVTWHSVTWKAEIDADLSPQSLVYASATTGNHAGGFFDANPPNTFNPETVTSFELGTKNLLLERRLSINGDFFYERYSDYQIEQTVHNPVTGDNNAELGNIPQIQNIYGIESEATFLPTSHDRFGVVLTWLHSYYSSGLSLTLPGTPPAIIGGLQLAGAPNWNTTISYEHNFNLPSGFKLAALVQSNLQSSQWMTYNHLPNSQQPGYTRTGLSLTATAPKDKYSIELWAKNLENKSIMDYATNDGSILYADVMPPRTFGVTIRGKFQ